LVWHSFLLLRILVLSLCRCYCFSKSWLVFMLQENTERILWIFMFRYISGQRQCVINRLLVEPSIHLCCGFWEG
jgi:hypothetical protein